MKPLVWRYTKVEEPQCKNNSVFPMYWGPKGHLYSWNNFVLPMGTRAQWREKMGLHAESKWTTEPHKPIVWVSQSSSPCNFLPSEGKEIMLLSKWLTCWMPMVVAMPGLMSKPSCSRNGVWLWLCIITFTPATVDRSGMWSFCSALRIRESPVNHRKGKLVTIYLGLK